MEKPLSIDALLQDGTTILQPLHSLIKRTKRPSDPPPWTDDTTTAFNEIKHALANATLLVHPIPNAPTSVMTDASDTAVGATWYEPVVKVH